MNWLLRSALKDNYLLTPLINIKQIQPISLIIVNFVTFSVWRHSILQIWLQLVFSLDLWLGKFFLDVSSPLILQQIFNLIIQPRNASPLTLVSWFILVSYCGDWDFWVLSCLNITANLFHTLCSTSKNEYCHARCLIIAHNVFSCSFSDKYTIWRTPTVANHSWSHPLWTSKSPPHPSTTSQRSLPLWHRHGLKAWHLHQLHHQHQ